MITKEQFLRYEKVRLSGKYNMITEMLYASKEARLTKEQYLEIIKNYSELKEKYILEKGE